jgi:hypothetical protein
MQQDARDLACLLSPVRASAARDDRVATRDVLGVKIPAERNPVMCPKSPSTCNFCYTVVIECREKLGVEGLGNQWRSSRLTRPGKARHNRWCAAYSDKRTARVPG